MRIPKTSLVALVCFILPGIALAQDAAPAPAAPAEAVAAPAPAAPVTASTEICNDGIDNDGDTMVDCADNDCIKTAECAPDGEPENTNARCSDWIDNDKNGFGDCDDDNCYSAGVTVCQGSWDAGAGAPGAATNTAPATYEVINAAGETPASTNGALTGKEDESMLGTLGDIDGEKNDILCSDGIDNDGDGRIDCADFGCRYSSEVTICRGNPGMRFSIVGNIAQEYNSREVAGEEKTSSFDTRFSKLQLRSLGPIPLIQDSFYLLSMRAEKTVRVTFAMFQVPIGGGHFINLNSGGAGLSYGMILSTGKRALLDPPYYLYDAFEQGNGAAVDLGGPVEGPIPAGKLSYRVFFAGGSGRFSGNIGGRYFKDDNTNYTFAAGGQLSANIMGHSDRHDSEFLFVPVAPTVSVRAGVKYDQRAQERYPAWNAGFVLRHSYFQLLGEYYGKRELNFGNNQNAFNIAAGLLVWPKHIMLAADFGMYTATPYDNEFDAEYDVRRIMRNANTTQFRVAAHYYFWSNVGIATILFSDKQVDPAFSEEDGGVETHDQSVKLVAQFRF